MHHKRKLDFTHFKENREGAIWSLFWYGRIFFKANKSKFYIEAYLVLMKQDNFFLDNINKNKIEKIEIPFSKSILFPLSSQFNHEGKFLRMSQIYGTKGEILKIGLYKTSRLQLSNNYNFRIKELDTILSNSLFPDVYENGISIYQDSSYFIRKIEKNESEKIQTQYIIPIDVVLKYFLGFSSLIFDLLISNRLKYAVLKKSYDAITGKGILYYDSNLITRSDVSLIAKYFFTTNDFAKKLFDGIGSYFSTLRSNNDQKGSFIKFKIPFDFPCYFVFVGQYITKLDSKSKVSKIIVNQILEISSDEIFFLIDDDIDLIDINSSENKRDEENESKVRDVKFTNEINPVKEEYTDDLPLDKNNNDKIVDNPIVLRNCFIESPKVNHLIIKKEKDENLIFLNDESPIDHSDFPDFRGTTSRKISNINTNWIEIIEEAIEYLVEKFGYTSNRLSDKVSERLTKKAIFNLNYKGANYYILDSGGNHYFPLFRNKIKTGTLDIDVIIEIIEIIKRDYKSSWSVVSNKQSLKKMDKFSSINFLDKNDVLFLRNNTHEWIGKENEDERTKTIENLAEKIHKKIVQDIKSSEN